jgi:hypothetical protein
LRDAEDVYWRERDDKKWKGFPYVRNLERWIVQRDVAPDGIARRGRLKYAGDPGEKDAGDENGTAYESLRTRRALYFDVDSRFTTTGPIELKVTYRDFARRAWRVDYRTTAGAAASTPVVRGSRRGKGVLRTVTFRIDDAGFDNGLAGGTDFALRAVRGELEASFVRVVRFE